MESIADFAESLILGSVSNIQEGKEVPPSAGGGKPAPGTPDIRNTKVPADFMAQVLGEEYVPESEEETEIVEEEVVEEEESPVQVQALITESQANELIDLLQDVKGLLQEMTTTGNLGMNLGGSSKKDMGSCSDEERKKGYKPATAASVLRANLKSRLKKKK